jgi:hypothetical protein
MQSVLSEIERPLTVAGWAAVNSCLTTNSEITLLWVVSWAGLILEFIIELLGGLASELHVRIFTSCHDIRLDAIGL